jgi:hypothetical protein
MDGKFKRPLPKKNNVFWANYDVSNPVESSGIVGKYFPFDLRIEALHRFETHLRETCSNGYSRSNSSNCFEAEDLSSTETRR